MTTKADIRVVFQPDGVKDVINGLRSIRSESRALQKDIAATADPFARRGGFVNLFEKAEPEAKKFGLTLGSVLTTAQRLVPVLGFAGAVTGIISVGRSALQTASEISDLNQQFRTTAEELSTLRFLARTNGSSNEEIERGLSGLAKSQRELLAGTEDTVAAYADLNLTAKDFQGLNLAQSFELIAKNLQGIDPTRLNLDAILGRNARRLLPALNDLADKGFAGVTKEAERMGAVFDTKTTAQTKSLSDQFDLAAESVQGLGNTIVRNASAIVRPITSLFTWTVNAISQLIDFERTARDVYNGVRGFFGGGANQPTAAPRASGQQARVDTEEQRQLLQANRRRSEETFKLLAEENRRRQELAEASIERERQLATTRAAANDNQIQAAREVLEAEERALRERIALAKSTARTEEDIVRARHEGELALARQASASDAGFAARRVDIDRKAAQDRAKIAQTYYAELQRLEAAALAQFRASKDAQKAIENEILGIRKSAEELAFEGRISKSGPVTQSIEREKRALEQIELLKKAAARGDIERARQLRSEIEGQARTIAGLDTVFAGDIAQRVLQQANAVFEPLLQQQLKVEQQREANAKKAINDLNAQLQTVEREINRLQANPLSVQVALDNNSMQATIRAIQEQLGRTPFQIAVQPVVSGAGGSVPGFADGGLLPGRSPGPRSDNLLFAGTAGEFMQPVRAVRHYGLGFMEAIRTLQVPRFADGGMLGAGGGGGTASGATDRMELSITIGGRRLGSVFGPRDTVRGIAEALREVSD